MELWNDIMNKFKELLFLKSIKRVGKVKIHDIYLSILDEASDLDDLVMLMEYKFNIDINKLEAAKNKAEKLYENIISDSNIKVITIFDDEYPEKLNLMGNKKPLILYLRGNVEALTKPNLAVIGTRKPSKFSEVFEENLVKDVVKSLDRVIVSGLALGCDKIAHKATVDENKETIAILPSGVNNIKPATNKKLAEEIIRNGGCLISEYEPDKSVYKSTYVERDQIVAAFSDAIFVVECGVQSGTMHTVDFASNYNKPIYTFIPDERPVESYDGNEFILNQKNGIKVEDIYDFLSDLKTLESNKRSVQSVKKSNSTNGDVQTTLM